MAALKRAPDPLVIDLDPFASLCMFKYLQYTM